MVQLQTKGKEKKQQTDYAEHLILKIDNKHVKKSLTMKKEAPRSNTNFKYASTTHPYNIWRIIYGYRNPFVMGQMTWLSFI